MLEGRRFVDLKRGYRLLDRFLRNAKMVKRSRTVRNDAGKRVTAAKETLQRGKKVQVGIAGARN